MSEEEGGSSKSNSKSQTSSSNNGNDSVEGSSETRDSVENILKILRDEFYGADFLVSLFWAAMTSFRHDSILRPFPTDYVDGLRLEGNREIEGEKDIEGLRQVFNSLPPLQEVAKGKAVLSTQQASLLQWILTSKKLTVSSTDLSQLEKILEQLSPNTSSSPGGSSRSSQLPKFMFEVRYSDDLEARFQELAKDHGTTFAFHGSSVENFHSIVHNGLLNIFNKVSAFGEGNYLSSELSVCQNWSPGGLLWPHSSLAQSASCIALCELIKHPSVLSRSQVGGEPSLLQKVPEKYFVVKNDEFVRVKYVLVFETQKQIKPSKVRSSLWKMLGPYKFVIVILLYVFFLLYIGASQSKFFKRLLKKYYFR